MPKPTTMGVVTEMLGDKNTAEGYYKKAVTADPSLIDAATNLAALYLDEPARPDEAISVLTKALEKAPGDAALSQNLGYAYGLKKDIPNAESKAYEAALGKGENPQIRFAYGALLFDANEMPKAAEQLKKALDATKDDAPMLGDARTHARKSRRLRRVCAGVRRGPQDQDGSEWLVRRGTCKHERNDEPGRAPTTRRRPRPTQSSWPVITTWA